jgi:hypothetical protein
MFSYTKIALAAALILGAGSAALAGNDRDDSVSAAQAEREWKDWQQGLYQQHMSTGKDTYGYMGQPGRTQSLKNRQ